ncbi:MAG: protoheme IX farnesyltransferase [Bacteroidetes bacterium]|nr:protoheme IX farnesyltransferase [Bacteroidota bacterium]MCH8942877.1 protoheme IX farnesyltransferase [Bacteroidota bacterium]
MEFKEKINILLELTKIKITSFVTLTTVFGFILASNSINEKIILPTIGVLLLACGAAVINHIQERKTDALMERTKNRPLPSGKVKPITASFIALVLLILGSIFLSLTAGFIALGLGLFNLIWYNVIYTPLKKKTAFAIIPGSLVGAIPPAIGWVAGGGSLSDPRIAFISFFFFIWQIPHFWLLLFIFGKDYEKAGLPSLTKIFNLDQLGRITFIWILATIIICLFLPVFGIVKSLYINIGLLLSGFWLTWSTFKLLRPNLESKQFKLAFYNINTFVILIIFLISIDNLFILY